MAKTIMVSDDVYEMLVKAKLPGESFSDVIRRALRSGRSLSSLAGSKTVTREEWSRVEDAFKEQGVLDEVRRRLLLESLSKG
ncbi:MAG: hypothetical protein DRJ68_04465 [Thermoprotei archaeon]|nr:MAG: hypothetical protein DRJ62_03805 [Thermoprotei archaeon]RLF20990.1 MAG: hypothetical protein DRJ68_04465 [Thermoprotei archaeon]